MSMMNKIPTAEEFAHKIQGYMGTIPEYTTEQALIEFAKLHVQAALEAAAINAHIDEDGFCNSDGDWENLSTVNKESILSAYPLNNVK